MNFFDGFPVLLEHSEIPGLPNTGKSSLINSLKRSRTCNVGAMPGVTK